MSALKKGYAETPSGLVHWRGVEGPNPPIVLLHRTPVSSDSFAAVLARLAGQRRAIALDTPGFGQSFHPTGSPNTVDYAGWFLAALDALGVEQFHLFGHHTGTHFATEMARLAPDRVLSLGLSGVLYTDAETRAKIRAQIGDAPTIDENGAHLDKAWKLVKGFFSPYDPQMVQKEALGALNSPEGCNQAFSAICGQDFAKALGQVRAPVRIIQAQDDPLGFFLGTVREHHPDILIETHGPAGMAAPELRPYVLADRLLRQANGSDAPLPPKSGSSMSNRSFQLVRTPTTFDLKRTDAPIPEPGPNEVVLRVRAVSLNRRDVSIRDFSYPTFSDTLTPLSDAAGEIAAVGPGVTSVAVGDRVTSTFFQNWASGRVTLPAVMSSLGAGGFGVLGDYVLLSAHGVAPIPAGMDFETAATLPCAAVTAWSALFTHGKLQADDWVLIIGTGGVALFALQLAVAAGAKVAIISSSDEKLERAKAMGAEVLVNYVKTPDWDAVIRDKTGGGGVQHVVELGGAGTLARSAASLGVGGHLALIGGLDGFGGEIAAVGLVMGAQSVTAITVGSHAEHTALVDFIAKHKIKPVIDRVFDIDAIEEAYGYSGGGAFGKVVVKLS